MFSHYDIIKYDGSSITYRFNNDLSKIITIDINTIFPSYEPCYDYYFNPQNIPVRIKDSNGQQELIIKETNYIKCQQYQYDKYNRRFPICDNGLLYKHLEEIYPILFN